MLYFPLVTYTVMNHPLVPTLEETAQQEERLAAKLRELNIDPDAI